MNQPNGQREWLAITPAEYHELDAYGSSALRTFILGGPLEFHDACIRKIADPVESHALLLGNDFHKACQFADWKDRFRILPERIEDDDVMHIVNDMLRKNAKPLVPGDEINTALVAHRNYLDAHRDLAISDGVECVDGRVVGMIAACLDNPAIAELIEGHNGIDSEVACILQHGSGLKFKALCDLLLPTAVLDFKSTARRNPNDFLRDAFRKYGYQWQAALYCIVTGRTEFYFVSVTSKPSYEANLFRVPDELLKSLIKRTEKHIEQLALFLRMAGDELKDSQGIPPSFHSEGWGTVMTFSEGGPMDELVGFEEVAA